MYEGRSNVQPQKTEFEAHGQNVTNRLKLVRFCYSMNVLTEVSWPQVGNQGHGSVRLLRTNVRPPINF